MSRAHSVNVGGVLIDIDHSDGECLIAGGGGQHPRRHVVFHRGRVSRFDESSTGRMRLAGSPGRLRLDAPDQREDLQHLGRSGPGRCREMR